MGSRQDNYRIIQTTESEHNPAEIQKKILNKNIKTLKRPRSTLNNLVRQLPAIPTMHDPSSLVAIIESFSDEIVQSLATYTSIRTHIFRGPPGNCPLFIQL